MSTDTQEPEPCPEAEKNSTVKRYLSLNNRYLAPILITGILLYAQWSYGILESWTRTLLAIATAIGMELTLARYMTGKWPHLASAYISGISVGILIRSPLFWPYALCSALSIMSKYVLRWHDKHLWNPSNFGVSAMLVLYPAAVATLSIQWGNAIPPMVIIWILGSLIIMRLKRFHICVTYVVAFLVFSFIRCQITDHTFLSTIAPLTGPMYQLFVFFMITDPKTTVSSRKGQCIVAALVAFVEMLLRLAQIVNAPFYALFLVGPVAYAIEIARNEKKKRDENTASAEESASTDEPVPTSAG